MESHVPGFSPWERQMNFFFQPKNNSKALLVPADKKKREKTSGLDGTGK